LNLYNELPKTVMSAVVVTGIFFISRLVVTTPNRSRFYFNKALKTRNAFIVEIFQ